ncbi:MAG: hypothetical protein LBL25_03900 [Oscillospiraceae bacterium]|jgi:hypothetical protein|nr:hypothetical protein [Oscillospiraceae bacterium]
MKKPNTIEREIDMIRLNIYNETKGMSPEQVNDYYRRRAEARGDKYNFKRAAAAVTYGGAPRS